MANLYRSGYLHLFFEDYVNQGESANFNPYAEIWKAKTTIKNLANSKLKAKIGSLNSVPDIEELYSLKEGDFSGLGGDVQERWQQANAAMADFDAAIAALKQLIKEKDTDVDYATYLSDMITNSIDQILLMGAQTGGLADGAISQIRNFQNKFNTEVIPHLKWGYYRINKNKNSLINSITAVQSNVSGYMLEVANVYAFLGAGEASLAKIINIGSHNSVLGSGVKITLDPKLLQDHEKLAAAISENNGQQSKVDNILMVNISNGNGTVSMETSYVGLQNKNIKDLSKVKVASYTLGQLGISNFYSANYLANVAGGLAGDKYRLARSTVDPNLRTHSNTMMSQGYVDEIWANIKNSMKVLAYADAIAGEAKANITNKIDYYVVRSKGTGAVRVISVGAILQNLLEKNMQSDIGDKVNFVGGKNASREEYWTINYQNYVPLSEASSKSEAAVTRSNKAYSAVLQAIMRTKLQITIDFRSWF